jgi:ribosomal protein S18 acetylase RimI-like enzyme
MNIEIRPLTPENSNTFTDYLGGPLFAHNPNWSGCYCRFYHLDCEMETWISRAGETNRSDALGAISRSEMKGWLAFDGDHCIGWCNANALSTYLRMKPFWPEDDDPSKLGATMCFVVHPDSRGQGIARKLLRTAVEEFRASGFKAVLAFPVKSETNHQNDYRGTLNMYLELGYRDLGLVEGTRVFRLDF